jgi:hypothetical protein
MLVVIDLPYTVHIVREITWTCKESTSQVLRYLEVFIDGHRKRHSMTH